MKPKRNGPILRFGTLLSLLILFVLICAVMGVAITPQNYNLKPADIASVDILAVREVVDVDATQAQKQAARAAVPQVFSVDKTLTLRIEQKLADYFASVANVRMTAAQMLKPFLDEYEANGSVGTAPTYSNSLKESQWQTLLSLWPAKTDKTALGGFMAINEESLLGAQAQTTAIFAQLLDTGVRESQLLDTASALGASIDALSASAQTKALMKQAALGNIEANAFFDSAATEHKRNTAADAVPDVIFQKGQVVVRAGETVTQRHIEMLRSMGMLTGGIVWSVYIGAFSCALLAITALGTYLHYQTRIERDFKKVLMICIITLFIVLMSALIQRVGLELVPVTFVAISLALTIGRTTGIICGLTTTFICSATALATGLEALNVLTFLVSGALTCALAAFWVEKRPTRSGIIGVGIATGFAGAVLVLIVNAMTQMPVNRMLVAMGMEFAGGLLVGVLCLGTTPVWENVFSALTPMKLMELCNPTNALLKRLMFEAPGTYHHSVMVGNLAEAAAEAIGANGLLARVGAYYHDVGKLVAPQYFSENQQSGVNPHDMLPPLDSARIILRHPRDSAATLRDHGVAKPVIDIALQHHGSTTVGYFYQKAKEADPNTDKSEYRYSCGRPETPEAAIVMLADSCEAATRANGGDYEKTLASIIRERMEDGQLDHVSLTFSQLDDISNAFACVLRGAYHGRVQYPKTGSEPSP
jgi:hypothetical protein